MANTNKDPQFTAYIPEELLNELKRVAKRNKRSANAQLIWYLERGLESEVIMGDLQEAIQAKKDGKVVLADWTGRRVTINNLVQNQETKQWFAEWSHSDYPHSRWDDVDEDQQFIIRGVYGSHR